MNQRSSSRTSQARAATQRSHKIAVMRTRSNKMRTASNRSRRAPSAGVLKLLGNLERRQPAWAKRDLSASRRVFKNQCADKGFAIADERRVRERQFALSCPPRSLPPSAHLMSFEDARARSGSRQNAIPVIAVDPHMIDLQSSRARGV